MDWTLEVVVLPVSDIDRSVAFYRDQVGFHLDHDTRNEHMHVVKLTRQGWLLDRVRRPPWLNSRTQASLAQREGLAYNPSLGDDWRGRGNPGDAQSSQTEADIRAL